MNSVDEDFSLVESLLWTPERRAPASFSLHPGGDDLPPLEDGFVLLAAHLRRMQAAADFFGWSFDPAAARWALDGAAAGLAGDGNPVSGSSLRAFSAKQSYLGRGSAGDGGARRAPLRWGKVRLLMDRAGAFNRTAAPLGPSGRGGAGKRANDFYRLALAPSPVDTDDVFLRYKTTRRGLYDAALASLPGVDDALLWNQHGYLTETCIANLVVELDGALLTPPVSDGLLPGVLRGWLLEEGALQEAHIHRDELPRCARLWAINSVRGWMEARVDG